MGCIRSQVLIRLFDQPVHAFAVFGFDIRTNIADQRLQRLRMLLDANIPTEDFSSLVAS